MKKGLFIMLLIIGMACLTTGCGEDCPTPELSRPNGTIEYEEVITEEILTEEIQTETFISEEFLKELEYNGRKNQY